MSGYGDTPLIEETRVDFSLMADRVDPIAGVGSEVFCCSTGWSWCGYCGFTGRVLGPRQASCPERHGWHLWLQQNADHELPPRCPPPPK